MKKIIKCIFCFLLLVIGINVYASPVNDLFLDDNLYKCIIDAYNVNLTEKKDYTYNILPEEANTITNLDCSSYKGTIENLTGLDRLRGLTSINLSGNLILGGSLNITGASGKLKSNIILPSTLSLTDISYEIENKSIVKITDNIVYPLSNGSTYVTMTGKVSGNEIKEKYLVTVSNPGLNKSNNAKLASLYLSKGEFSFDNNITEYSVIVDKSVESVKINANVLDKNARFVSGFGPRTVNLKEGSNTLLVKVKAEDGTVLTYTIMVIRSDGNDLNNRLVNIELSIGKIDFKPDVYVYNFNVDSNINEIDVKGIAESSLASVDVSDTRLKVGTNKITITVTSESGSKCVYELIVNREDYDSLDNYLKGLTIKNYKIDFKRDIFNYEITIGGEKTLVINPITEKSDATYNIVGNSELKNDSKIVIKVSDKEGSTREYNIIVKKNNLFNLTFLIDNVKWFILGLEFLIILILIIVIISRGGPKKPKKAKKVEKKIQPQIVSNVCNVCGAANDIKSKTCYVCGNLLK